MKNSYNPLNKPPFRYREGDSTIRNSHNVIVLSVTGWMTLRKKYKIAGNQCDREINMFGLIVETLLNNKISDLDDEDDHLNNMQKILNI